jgi:hypothetical protein
MKVINILVASTLVACGAVNAPSTPGDDDSGSGSDMGSGSGSDAPHAPGQLYGSVHDERGDAIDFSTGVPVHTHDGPLVQLGTGCPAVYKYAYLLDQQAPLYGLQSQKNPLVWQVSTDVASIDPGETSYRVRSDDGRTLLDWIDVTPDAHGLYTIELHRSGDHPLAALGTDSGKMYIDVRFHDSAGTETIHTGCWEHHPLAAPLQVIAPAQSDLFQMTLPLNSAISKAMNPVSIVNYGVDVLSERIIQSTGEPITIAVALPQPTGHVAVTYVSEYPMTHSLAASAPCPSSTTGPCSIAVPAKDTESTTGDLVSSRWSTRVVDETGALVCQSDFSTTKIGVSGCTLPARAANSTPKNYRLIVSVGDVRALEIPRAVAGDPYAEHTLNLASYTGTLQPDAMWACINVVSNGSGGYSCTSFLYHAWITALSTAHIDFDPMTIGIDAATTPSSESLPAADATTTTTGMSWDAGTETYL